MSLQTRLSSLITAIGADIKSLNTQMTTHTHAYLSSTGKAADAELLDGVDSAEYLRKGMSDASGSRNTKAATTLNARLVSGWYDGSSLTGAPDTNWWLVEVLAHSNGSHWQRQIAYSMTSEGASQSVYSRRCNGGDPTLVASWTAWKPLGDGQILDGGAP